MEQDENSHDADDDQVTEHMMAVNGRSRVIEITKFLDDRINIIK